jgi:signal peptidase I
MAARRKGGRPAATEVPVGRPATFTKSTLREYFESIVVAVVLALFVRTWVVQAFKIPTGSMEQNLLIGDHLLVNKFVYGPTRSGVEEALLPMRPPRRGEIVVFKYPDEPDRDFIKRVVGLPGETVELRDKQVHINGVPLDEPYVYFLNVFGASSQELTSADVRVAYGPVTVPEDHYFVMGDNRDNSQDSRYWGFLPAHYLKGRAMVIYWSYESESTDYAGADVGSTVSRLVSVVTHVFTRTRWERVGRAIR